MMHLARAVAVMAACSSLMPAQVVEGVVRNSTGQTLAGVTVSLATSRTRTDARGSYRLTAAHGGTYTLRAESSNYVAVSDGPFVLAPMESKRVDLTMKPLQAEFYDEPSFIVAGVTDTTNRGGHGSGTVIRSTEALTKATASLGDRAEKQEDALAAVRSYQRAAESSPGEPNFFNWGSELLTHRATLPAIEVFTKGVRLFPRSTRMMLGLAVSWYSHGSDQKASMYLFAACDLNSADPLPYLFLGRVQSAAITQSSDYLVRMERFAELHPENALANYYYGASLWNQRHDPRVEKLLQTAISLDPHLDVAYLLLGTVYSDSKDSINAIAAYQKADLDEAHYRLAQEYRKIGENQKADNELSLYGELSKRTAEEAQRERQEIGQFVYSLR